MAERFMALSPHDEMMEEIPSPPTIACSFGLVKQETGLSNQVLGEKTGVSAQTMSLTLKGITYPNQEVMIRMIELVGDYIFEPERQELLMEYLVQSIVPHFEAAQTAMDAGQQNPLEQGLRVKKKFDDNRERRLEILRNPQRRRLISEAKRKNPAAHPDAILIDNILSKIPITLQDLADVSASSKTHLSNAYHGRHGLGRALRERLLKVLDDFESESPADDCY